MNKQLAHAEFEAHPAQLKAVRTLMRERLAGAGCDRELIDDLVLAINEACMNIIQHAYADDEKGRFVLEAERYDNELVFRLTDFAPKIDQSLIKSRDLDDVRPGGLGVYFIHSLMDEVEFLDSPSPSGNVLQMKKRVEWDLLCHTKQKQSTDTPSSH